MQFTPWAELLTFAEWRSTVPCPGVGLGGGVPDGDTVALGIAVGTVSAALLCAFSVVWIIRGPDQALGVWLLGENYLLGYAPTPIGALLGAVWGFALGFAAGWTLAMLHNLFITAWVVFIGARERLKASSDFLDEI